MCPHSWASSLPQNVRVGWKRLDYNTDLLITTTKGFVAQAFGMGSVEEMVSVINA